MSFYKKGEMLGKGGEGEVFDIKKGPFAEKKEGVYDTLRTENFTKAEFYFTKILHALYPEHIPDIRLTAKHDNRRTTIREKKNLVGGHKTIMNGKLEKEKRLDLSKYNEAIKNLEQKSIESGFITKMKNLGIWVDSYGINFAEDEDGNFLFVDSFKPWRLLLDPKIYIVFPSLNFNKINLIRAIKEKFYNDKKQEKNYCHMWIE